ncbi:hypothetical protein VE02_04848 [Pseudogymnoascus sp. 03VT05]|nr:hypothetical protein VE02_04848 [Pseudogymnoascus sp. 03VT05]
MGTLCEQSILAVAGPVAWLLAGVNTATKAMSASLSTGDLRRPARLVFKDFLAAHACLLHEVRTLGAGLSIAVTLVVDCWVATCGAPIALMRTRRRLSAAWEWWVKHSPTAVAGDLIKDGFSTGAACATVTEFLARMLWIPTFQISPADSCAYMLSLIVFRCPTRYFLLSLRRNAFPGSLLSRTTMLTTLMSSTVESRLANPHALRESLRTLVADS